MTLLCQKYKNFLDESVTLMGKYHLKSMLNKLAFHAKKNPLLFEEVCIYVYIYVGQNHVTIIV